MLVNPNKNNKSIQNTRIVNNPTTRQGLCHAHAMGVGPNKKKKPTSKHRITHIHPDGHQPTNNHATEPNIQYTVTANNQQPIALPRNRIQHPKKTVNTRPTTRRCSIKLHVLTQRTSNPK